MENKNRTKIETKNNRLERSSRHQRGAIVGLSIATGALALTSLGLALALANEQNQTMQAETELANVYQKNLYDLVEGVNNAEIHLLSEHKWLSIADHSPFMKARKLLYTSSQFLFNFSVFIKHIYILK